MSTFTLRTSFTNADLEGFYATGTNIVVAKASGSSAPNVAWIVYQPLITNMMTWEEKYGIYASTVDIKNGVILTQMSQSPFPAIDGKAYILQHNCVFTPASEGGIPNSYCVLNDFDNLPRGYLTMGLFQDAILNGVTKTGSAVSATAVPYKGTAVMTPFTSVYLWSQTQVRSSMVVTNVTSRMTKVDFGGSVTEVSLQYDPSAGIFVPLPGLKLDTGIEIIHPKL